MKKNLPDLQFHSKLRDFFENGHIELWIKMIHLFIMIDAKSKGKDGYTIWYQNPGLRKRFTIRDDDDQIVYQPSIENIQKSIAKLEGMGLISRTVSTSGERRIKLNRALVLAFLREYDLKGTTYKTYRIKSRERKLIRKKIITLVDYVNEKKRAEDQAYRRYLQMQHKKYGFDITDNVIEIFDYDYSESQLVTTQEIEFIEDTIRGRVEQDAILDNLWNSIRVPSGMR
jgi:hypothetical protein